MTFCSLLLVPETSNLIFFVVRSNEMSSLFTVISEDPVKQELYPLVWRTSLARTPNGAEASSRNGASMLEYEL